MMATFEKRGEICIWWFPKEFSQSRYGEYYQSGRNSCTLISLILANKIAREREFCQIPHQLPRRAVDIFAAAINDGNAVYHRLEGRVEMQMRDSRNLNIPDAIEALQMHRRKKDSFHLKELFFTHLQVDPTKRSYPYVAAERLTQIFNVGLQLHKEPIELGPAPTSARASPLNQRQRSIASQAAKLRSSVKNRPSLSTNFTPGNTARPIQTTSEELPALTARHLFVIVIADSRTTTFVFEVPNNVVAFIDSHHHGRNTGAVIAQAEIKNLDELAFWFVNMLAEIYQSKPNLYEISFFSTESVEIPSPFA